jgi:hypothetical protein
MKQPLAPIVNDFKGKDIVSLSQFDRPSVETVFSAIQQIKTTFASTRFTDTFKNYTDIFIFFYGCKTHGRAHTGKSECCHYVFNRKRGNTGGYGEGA